MKDFFLRITSILLIAILAIGSNPSSLLHEHEEVDSCHHEEDLYQVDACHIALRHSVTNADMGCEHKSHFRIMKMIATGALY